MSNLVYTDAHTTSLVANPEGNLEVTSYISGASEVPLNIVLQEMFSDETAHHISSPPVNIQVKNPQPSSLQAKTKKLMQKAKKNMRKIKFKRAVSKKFKEYTQKLEALTSVNVSEATDMVVHARVLTEMKKLLPTHGEKKKKRRKDTSQASSKSSRKNKAPMVHYQEDTPADQPQDQEDLYVQERPNAGRFTKKSRSAGGAKEG
nr:hypothetical protein [Tanacetum cinerariifolium]